MLIDQNYKVLFFLISQIIKMKYSIFSQISLLSVFIVVMVCENYRKLVNSNPYPYAHPPLPFQNPHG